MKLALKLVIFLRKSNLLLLKASDFRFRHLSRICQLGLGRLGLLLGSLDLLSHESRLVLTGLIHLKNDILRHINLFLQGVLIVALLSEHGVFQPVLLGQVLEELLLDILEVGLDVHQVLVLALHLLLFY